MDGGRYINGETRDCLRLLRGAVPWRNVHNTHASWQSFLRCQPHRPVLSHICHLVSGILPSGGVWWQSQPGDNHSARLGRVFVDGRRDDAANSRCHSDTRFVWPHYLSVFFKFQLWHVALFICFLYVLCHCHFLLHWLANKARAFHNVHFSKSIVLKICRYYSTLYDKKVDGALFDARCSSSKL